MSRRRVLVTLTALVFAALPGEAYFMAGHRWTVSNVRMELQVGGSGTLIDGHTSWNAVAETALAIWNSNISGLQFGVIRSSTAGVASGNDLNNVIFDDDVFGQPFGDAIAVALTLSFADGRASEADVVFKSDESWNSYRGPQQPSSTGGWLYDMRRVALHEFGHVLGLAHPDEHGQSVAAIMNHRVSDIDTLQPDDINGARALYASGPAPPPPPPPATDTLATNGRLTVGQSRVSRNGRYRLVYQSDGNLTLFDNAAGVTLWSTNSAGTTTGVAVMQGDGNFVLYDGQGGVRFATMSTGSNALLVVQDDGNLVVYRGDGVPIWHRHMTGAPPPPPPPPPNTISETFAGSVSTSDAVCAGSSTGSKPCVRHTFTVTNSGTAQARLSWSTSQNDLDLELWRGSTKVASSDGVTAEENVSAAVSAGAYEWRVVYYGGFTVQSYTLTVNRPR